ncbi:MAG: hypothetical protein KatS3mg035_1595 [Bacteroidia bacterium]|nr:MAG: hypothetical protein KatS3mg035_1595 [Bacteroidia bacterium]
MQPNINLFNMTYILYYVPLYGALLILWGYLNSRFLNQAQEISWWNKILIRISSWSGILGGLLTILGIMHTMIINLGRSVAIHEFNHSATWFVLLIGAIAGLFAFLFYLKNKKIWPELIIAIASIIEVIFCFLIIGYFSR